MFQMTSRAVLLAAVFIGASFADPITLTFTGPASGVAGSTVTLSASVVNTSGDSQSLDSIAVTLVPSFNSYDATAFFTFWPVSLDASGPNAQFGPAAIFDVDIPGGTLTGDYTGNTAQIYGGGGTVLLTTQSFEIDVVSSAPEPATLGLTGAGILALGLWRRRRSRAARQLT